MLYALVRQLLGFALRVFYRVERAEGALPPVGPLLLLGNHPNALVDPAFLLAVSPRPLTFLAKAPLFRVPGLGQLLRALGALPIQRPQDGPQDGTANAAVLQAGSRAVASGRALAIFPEGKSHSDPHLADLKTGAARMVLAAGTVVQVVPVGLTYAQKGRFRSAVHIEFGACLLIAPNAEPSAAEVRALTARMGEALRAVTLELDAWEDLPLIATAEALYALRTEGPSQDAERRRLFARGMALLRAEQPERYAEFRGEVAALARRLALVHAGPGDVAVQYRPVTVLRFMFRNAVALLVGLPLALAGWVLFLPWTLLVRAGLAVAHTEEDMRATVKLVAALVLGPLYVLALALAIAHVFGWRWAALLLVSSVPLALFARSFLARRREALRDARLFFQLGNRSATKRHLVAEGQALAERIQALVEELGPRVSGQSPHPAPSPEPGRQRRG
jgi:glycerol-3-phosphate O-acyltransferase / dihydroxyacetone phosphate acyltransferase